jgi:SAM-dependent methyltransferase
MLALGAQVRYLAYRLTCPLHWKPRERAIARVLSGLGAEGRAEGDRVVDIGCGLGGLAPVALHNGFRYLGLEPDPALLLHCRRHHRDPRAQFLPDDVSGAAPLVAPRDVVILNGVAHHLDDADFRRALQAARGCRALVIADHWRRDGELSRVTRWLQAQDRGKAVRDYAEFEGLPGFELASSEVFRIGPLGSRLWVYFCNCYRPRPARPAPADA